MRVSVRSEVHDVGARLDAARGAVRGGHQLVRGGAGGARDGGARRALARAAHRRPARARRARRPPAAGRLTHALHYTLGP